MNDQEGSPEKFRSSATEGDGPPSMVAAQPPPADATDDELDAWWSEYVKILTSELRAMRKGAGINIDKLTGSKYTLFLLGGSGAFTDGTNRGIGRLYTALNRSVREGSKEHGALLNAFNIGTESRGHGIVDRRATYAAQMNISPDTVELWENRAIDRLAVELIREYRRVKSRISNLMYIATIEKWRHTTYHYTYQDPARPGERYISQVDPAVTTEGVPTLPMVIWVLPPEMSLNTLQVGAMFTKSPPPSKVWAFYTEDFEELVTMPNAFVVQPVSEEALERQIYSHIWKNPTTGIYGVMWER